MISGLLIAAVFAGPAAAAPPDEAVAWTVKLQDAMAHQKSVDLGLDEGRTVGPLCPPPGEPLPLAPRSSISDARRAAREADPAAAHAACEAARPRSWQVVARISPADARIFNPLIYRISRVAEGQQAEAVLAELIDHGAEGAPGFHAIIPAGPYLVEVEAACGAGTLWAYELSDALAFVAAAYPPGPAARVAVSPCGRGALAWVSREAAVEDGQRLREAWGQDLPEARERAKARAK